MQAMLATEARTPLQEILIVDDDAAVRQRLSRVAAQVAPQARCALAGSLAEARAALAASRFDEREVPAMQRPHGGDQSDGSKDARSLERLSNLGHRSKNCH